MREKISTGREMNEEARPVEEEVLEVEVWVSYRVQKDSVNQESSRAVKVLQMDEAKEERNEPFDSKAISPSPSLLPSFLPRPSDLRRTHSSKSLMRSFPDPRAVP